MVTGVTDWLRQMPHTWDGGRPSRYLSAQVGAPAFRRSPIGGAEGPGIRSSSSSRMLASLLLRHRPLPGGFPGRVDMINAPLIPSHRRTVSAFGGDS